MEEEAVGVCINGRMGAVDNARCGGDPRGGPSWDELRR